MYRHLIQTVLTVGTGILIYDIQSLTDVLHDVCTATTQVIDTTFDRACRVMEESTRRELEGIANLTCLDIIGLLADSGRVLHVEIKFAVLYLVPAPRPIFHQDPHNRARSSTAVIADYCNSATSHTL